MKSIASIGTATQDVFLVGDPFDPHKDGKKEFVKIELGEKLSLDTVMFTTGGNAGNTAVTFARQGLDSMFVGAVGDDAAGSAVNKEFKKEDVDSKFFIKDEKYSTSYSAILLSSDGERTVLNYKGNSYQYLSDFDFSKIKTDYAYVSSVGGLDNLKKILTSLHKSGVKIAYNPGSRELKESKKLMKLIDKVHILLVNKDEAKDLFGKSTDVSLLKEAAKYVDYFVMTDGPNGVIATDGKKVVSAGMYEDVPVKDRLGAGDAFGSGFVASIVRGQSLEDAITFASANSTSVVQYIGAKEGILSDSSHIHDMPLEVKSL